MWLRSLFNSRKPRSPRAPARHRPLLEALEDRTLLHHGLDTLSNGLSSSLAQLGGSVRAAVQQSTTDLPVLNQPLRNIGELTDVVNGFQDVISNKLRTLDDADLTITRA